ncbi:unnamed protein product, partial [Amoebophrya sp. A25]
GTSDLHLLISIFEDHHSKLGFEDQGLKSPLAVQLLYQDPRWKQIEAFQYVSVLFMDE